MNATTTRAARLSTRSKVAGFLTAMTVGAGLLGGIVAAADPQPEPPAPARAKPIAWGGPTMRAKVAPIAWGGPTM